MSDTITFDIETIPKQDPLTIIEKEELFKKLQKLYNTISMEDFENPNDTVLSDLNMLQATNPYFGEIVCIGVHRDNGFKSGSKAYIGKEFDILTNFWELLKDFKGSYISFNGLDFDVPYIIKRSMYHNILPTNKNFLNLRRYYYFPHFDIKAMLGNWDKYSGGSLKLACNFLDIASPKEGEVKAENVYSAYKDGHIQKIADYCLRDVEATYQLYKKVNNYI